MKRWLVLAMTLVVALGLLAALPYNGVIQTDVLS